jgi:hypothetical protein
MRYAFTNFIRRCLLACVGCGLLCHSSLFTGELAYYAGDPIGVMTWQDYCGENWLGAGDTASFALWGDEMRMDILDHIAVCDIQEELAHLRPDPNFEVNPAWYSIDWSALLKSGKWRAFNVDEALSELEFDDICGHYTRSELNAALNALPPIPSRNPTHCNIPTSELRELSAIEHIAVANKIAELRLKEAEKLTEAWDLALKIPDDTVKALIAGAIVGCGAANAPDLRVKALVALAAGAYAGGAAAAVDTYDVAKEAYISCKYGVQADYLCEYLASAVCLN